MTQNRLKLATLIAMCGLLTSCDRTGDMDAGRICDEHPQYCKGINKDGWCVNEREAAIVSRYTVAQEGAEDPQLYQALLNWEAYRDCIEKASAIEFNKLKIRKTRRVVGYLTSLQEIEVLSKRTEPSTDPYLLWYHWSRYSNKEAFNLFLQNQQQPEYDTPQLQLNLAMVYYDKDRPRTLVLLKKALSLYKSGDPVERDIVDQMASLYFQEKDYPRSYVWSRVSQLMDNEAVNLDLIIRKGKLDEAVIDKLENRASDLMDRIDSAEFTPDARDGL